MPERGEALLALDLQLDETKRRIGHRPQSLTMPFPPEKQSARTVSAVRSTPVPSKSRPMPSSIHRRSEANLSSSPSAAVVVAWVRAGHCECRFVWPGLTGLSEPLLQCRPFLAASQATRLSEIPNPNWGQSETAHRRR